MTKPDDAPAWRHWPDDPPERYGRVEWVRVRDGRIAGSGDAIPAAIHPAWNINGVWWRPCAPPGEFRRGFEAAREAAAKIARPTPYSSPIVRDAREMIEETIRAMEPPA